MIHNVSWLTAREVLALISSTVPEMSAAMVREVGLPKSVHSIKRASKTKLRSRKVASDRRRKQVVRRTNLKNMDWYERAAMTLGISAQGQRETVPATAARDH
jgi:hypothetical protein